MNRRLCGALVQPYHIVQNSGLFNEPPLVGFLIFLSGLIIIWKIVVIYALIVKIIFRCYSYVVDKLWPKKGWVIL